MRRPASPDISEWIEAMDQHLSRRARQVTARSRRGERMAPLLTGSAALAAAALVVSIGFASPQPAASNSTVAGSEQPGVATVEPAPFGQLRDLITYEDATGVTASYDILGRDRGLTGTPRSDAPAVPTPDGGGSVPTALRPTVS